MEFMFCEKFRKGIYFRLQLAPLLRGEGLRGGGLQDLLPRPRPGHQRQQPQRQRDELLQRDGRGHNGAQE